MAFLSILASKLAINWGTVNAPTPYQGIENQGLANFIANIIRAVIVIAGLYTVFNFVLAGYSYLSAGGDPKKIADATAKIWQSAIGLLLVVGAFVIGGILSNVLFGNSTTIFEINIIGPSAPPSYPPGPT